MPTKKKRVGFIPREDVMKIIDKLSIENNLSNSKIINILVEEALSMRGIFNNKTGKVRKSYELIKYDFRDPTQESTDFNDNEKFTIKTKTTNQKNSIKTSFLKPTNNEAIDKEIYKKFLTFLKFEEMMNEYNS